MFSTVFGATSGQNSEVISPAVVLMTATSFDCVLILPPIQIAKLLDRVRRDDLDRFNLDALRGLAVLAHSAPGDWRVADLLEHIISLNHLSESGVLREMMCSGRS